MRTAVRILLLSEAFAVVTFALGWWTVPILGAAWALFSDAPRRAPFAALCAALGWASLLALDAARGPLGTVASQLGSVMGAPSGLLLLGTVAFAALLAWSAATVTPHWKKLQLAR